MTYALIPGVNGYVTPSERDWLETVPEDYRTARFADIEVRHQEAIRGWVDLFSNQEHAPKVLGPNLLITGPVGTGKTHVGFVAGRYIWKRGFTAWDERVMPLRFRYWPVVGLISELRKDENRRDDKGLTMKYVERSSVIYLDDIGAMRQTEWVLDELYLVLETRRSACRPVIATTNLPLPALKDYLGEAAFSRLAQGAVVIETVGSDRRGGDA